MYKDVEGKKCNFGKMRDNGYSKRNQYLGGQKWLVRKSSPNPEYVVREAV